MPDVLQAEPPRVDDAHRAARSNATQDSARDEKEGIETARNGSSFLAIIEEMLAGSMDGMDEIRQLSSLRTAEREAGGDIAPGESDALKKLGAGGATNARSGKNTLRPDALAPSMGQKSDANSERLDGKNALRGDGLKIAGEGRYESRFAALGIDADATIDPKTGVPRRSGNRTEAGDVSDAVAFSFGSSGTLIDPASLATNLVGRETLASRNGTAGHKDGSSDEDGTARTIGASARSSARDRKTTIAVRDERTFEALQERVADKATSGALETETTETADGVADMSIGFRTDRASGSGYGETQASVRSENAHAGEASFSTMLSQELRDQAGEFVKAGKIVLRDGNSGTIRLTLHPESLGNVRISLELSSDKRISGKIHVASKEAYDAFLENLDGLSDAFVEGGFESAGFDLSWSGSPGYAGADGNDPNLVSAPFYASSVPDVMSGPKSSDRFESGYRGYGMSAIDVFA